MPFHPVERMQPRAVLLDKLVQENPNDPTDQINIYICRPTVHVVAEKVKELGDDVNVEGVLAYLSSYRSEALEKMLHESGGVLRITLDNKDLELQHRVHFYLGARDRWPAEVALKEEAK